MKKPILGFVAIGAVIGSRPVATRMGRKMRAHCEQMVAQCKQMARQFETRGGAVDRT